MRLTALVLVLTGLPAVALAEDDVQPRRCTALQGNAAVRSANATHRRRYLNRVLLVANSVIIDHSHPAWERPHELQIEGIQLEAGPSRHSCEIKLSEELARRMGCRAAAYAVRADDALGQTTQVLLVLDGVVLVEHEGKLAYMAADDATPPGWLTAWRMPGVTMKRGATAGSQPPPKQRRHEKRRPKPRPRKRR